MRDVLPTQLLGGLEYYGTELGRHCDGWPQEDSFDGIYVEKALKSGDLGLEIRGSALFIDDQRECAFWLELHVDPIKDHIATARLRIGVPDEETGELRRLPYDSKEARRVRALVGQHAESLVWMLEVWVDGDNVETRSRRLVCCGDCESLYFESASRMASLCPECAHQLHHTPRCEHEFRRERCALCFWDGSAFAWREN